MFATLERLHHERRHRAVAMESADYEEADGPLLREHAEGLRKSDRRRHVKEFVARLVMCLIIAVFTSLLYLGLHHGTTFATAKRVNMLRAYLGSGSSNSIQKIAVAWAISFGLGIGMCYVGVCFILYEPSAAGSGMPEVISFLNGLVQPRYLTVKTFVCKFFGVFLIVAAGMFSGFDGPYLHLQGKPGVYNYLSNAKAHMLQQFVTIGAASGMASAFQAPIGGVMFALEEAMSFYEPSMLIRTLFAAVISMLVLGGMKISNKRFEVDKLSIYASNGECNMDTPVQDYLAIAFMGVVAGVIGHGYNVLVAKIRVFRTNYVQTRVWRRFFEIFVLVLITTAAIVLVPTIPVFRNCTTLEHAVDHLRYIQPPKGANQPTCFRTCRDWQDELDALRNGTSQRQKHFASCQLYMKTRMCFDSKLADIMQDVVTTNYYSMNCTNPDGSDKGSELVNLIPSAPTDLSSLMTEVMIRNTARLGLPEGLLIDAMGNNFAAATNKSNSDPALLRKREESQGQEAGDGEDDKQEDEIPNISSEELAERLDEHPEDACYHQMKSLLFNAPEFILKNLFLRGYYYLFQTPTLAAFGGLYLLLSLATHHISLPTDLVTPTLIIGATFGRLFAIGINEIKSPLGQTLVDPGAYAVLGMAGFWAGTSRMIITVVVVAAEATYDQSNLLGLVLVVLIAAGVGNMLGESQYHMEIEKSGVPFLPFNASRGMREKTVSEIMVHDPVVLAMTDSLETAALKIQPVDNATGGRGRHAHVYAASLLHSGFPVVSDMAERKLVGLILRHQVDEAVAAALEVSTEGEPATWFDYANHSPYSVSDTCSADKAYKLFRSLGLRHLVVVDVDNRVVGLLTRRNFSDAIHKEEEEEEEEERKRKEKEQHHDLEQSVVMPMSPLVNTKRKGSASGEVVVGHTHGLRMSVDIHRRHQAQVRHLPHRGEGEHSTTLVHGSSDDIIHIELAEVQSKDHN
ncbi:hypothetical protein RI367_005232 [Sorochytrium milnesiophthora]